MTRLIIEEQTCIVFPLKNALCTRDLTWLIQLKIVVHHVYIVDVIASESSLVHRQQDSIVKTTLISPRSHVVMLTYAEFEISWK